MAEWPEIFGEQTRQAQQKSGAKAQMHSSEQEIVPAIAKMRNTALACAELAHRRRLVDGRNPLPGKPDHRLRIEIEPAHA